VSADPEPGDGYGTESVPSPHLDDEVHRAAQLARDAMTSAAAAAGVARTVGAEFWKAYSAPSSPRDTVGSVAKLATAVNPLDIASHVAKMATTVNPAVAGTIGEGVRQVQQVASTVLGVDGAVARSQRRLGEEALRKRGDAILAVSYNAKFQPYDVHPSFSRILDELTPDEARILRFLAVAGPQPMINVRTKTLFQVGSELLASDINMVAELAGCQWRDRDQHYLANLDSLGLVRLSSEPVADYRRYALIEVQARAMEAIEKTKKSITVYRSIFLSPFGRQFVETCFDTEGYHAGGWDRDERGDKILGKGPPGARKPSAGELETSTKDSVAKLRDKAANDELVASLRKQIESLTKQLEQLANPEK
jgi:Abortive infection alpha